MNFLMRIPAEPVMRVLRRVLCVAALTVLAGCEWSPSFHLEDLRQLTPGLSTKEDLDRVFGSQDFVEYHLYCSCDCDRTPPFPLSFLTWPLFLQTHVKEYDFAVRLDSRKVMVSGELQVSEQSSTSVFCLFGPSDYTVHLE